jgi:hypothetical protein
MKNKDSSQNGCVPPLFLNRFGSFIQGALAGFDRLRLRGTLRYLYHANVMEAYLSVCQVLLKDFGKFAEHVTGRVKKATAQIVERSGRPYRYLNSSQISKEAVAREIARKDSLVEGLIAVLGCVEPCLSYNTFVAPQDHLLHLRLEQRKCMHFYYYFLHPLLGFMHVRQQTWFPFQMDVCLNGREWLSRQLDAAGIAYRKKENSFVWLENWEKAQALADEQLKTDWPKLLNGLLADCHPLAAEICQPIHQEYYWSASDTEFATDLLFQNPEDLARFYPPWVRHALSTFSSGDVMRFLGRNIASTSGRVPPAFEGEIITDLKYRHEGVRVKHSLNGNSIKIYDKHGAILRVETTIVHPKQFRVYRPPEGKPDGELAWRILRRSVADLHRRAQVSNAANQRYLTALASVSGKQSLAELTTAIAKPVRRKKRTSRGLNPWAPADAQLLEIISRGEFVVNGFRNRHLRTLLYPGRSVPHEQKRQAAAVTRKLRLLRDHHLIKKVPGTHRYLPTDKGRQTITALMAARQADVEALTKLAA